MIENTKKWQIDIQPADMEITWARRSYGLPT